MSSSSSSSSLASFPLTLSFPIVSHDTKRRPITRLQKRKEKWAILNLDTMPPDIIILILSYFHICQYDVIKKVFQLPRISKKMYRLIKEVFSNQCFNKPKLIRNVNCGNDRLTVVDSLQIISSTCTYKSNVKMCPHCQLYFCTLCPNNWCSRQLCYACDTCCMKHMDCKLKCGACHMFFSDIARVINDDMGYSSDDTEYFEEYDVISSCECNDGQLCVDCHDIHVL